MSKVIVHPSTLQGTVSVPCSKSAAHRAILCAALAQGESILSPIAVSNDIHVTAQAAQALGANILEEQRTWRVTGGNAPQSPTEIDCGESGSTLRFLIPICAALGMEATFTGHGRLPERAPRARGILPHRGRTSTIDQRNVKTGRIYTSWKY